MNRAEYPRFIDWWIANQAEYSALSDAQDGNPIPLAELIERQGNLATIEAREYVAARLKGGKKGRGLKRTIAQQAKEIGLLGMVREIQKQEGCGEPRAAAILLDSYPEMNQETLRTYLRRAKATLKNAFGKKPPPVVQKTRNSEPQ